MKLQFKCGFNLAESVIQSETFYSTKKSVGKLPAYQEKGVGNFPALQNRVSANFQPLAKIMSANFQPPNVG